MHNLTSECQVLIVGAGPVGLTLALALGNQKINVRLIDKALAANNHSKALVIWPRTLELLDIQGSTEQLLASGMNGSGISIRNEQVELVHMPFNFLESKFAQPLLIPQNLTEAVLQSLLTNLGISVERGTELIKFEQSNNQVHARLRHHDGSDETLHCQHLVGADGPHSNVRHCLGIDFEGKTLKSQWALADLKIEGAIPQNEITMVLAKDGLLGLFPIIGGRYRVMADLSKNNHDQDPTLEEIQSILDCRYGGGLRVHSPLWLSHFKINERQVREYKHGQVFLAGDAAHIHSPAGGQGMNTGMQDALNLAWKMALVLRGKANDSLLKTYSPERQPIAEEVLLNAGRLTRFAQLQQPFACYLRNFIIKSIGKSQRVQSKLMTTLSELNVNYRKSDLSMNLSESCPNIQSGDRIPNIMVQNGDHQVSLYTKLQQGNFVLLSINSEVTSQEIPDSFHSLLDSTSAVTQTRFCDGYSYLIRPDGYLSGSCKTPTCDVMLEWLKRWQ